MVKFLKNGEEKIPVKISFAALKNFQKDTGKNLTAMSGELSFEDIESLFYHAYVSGCKSSKDIGYEVKYSREEMEGILDEVYLEFIEVIPKFFADKKK